MNEFKAMDLRKRDSKAMYKQLESTSNQAEKSKEIKRIRFEVRDEYIKACIRCPIDPKIWINDIYPKEEHEVVHTLMIGGMFQDLKNCYETAKELYTPNQVYEPVDKTLEDYVSQTGLLEDSISCLKLVIKAGHGTILREITRLLFGTSTK